MDEKAVTEKSSTSLDVENLNKTTADVAQRIIEEPAENTDKVKQLSQLFNANVAKKNVARILKMNDLLDMITDQMTKRVADRPGEFSNADLLDYLSTIQTSLEKAHKGLSLVEDTPAIQIAVDNRSVNVAVDNFDRDSKERMIDAVKALMEKAKRLSEDGIENNGGKDDNIESNEVAGKDSSTDICS